MLPFRPMIDRGEYADPFFFTLPMLPWNIRSGGVGGSATSAAGISESYVVRKDMIAALTLRVLDEELNAVLAVLEAIRDGSASFRFAFDQDDPATDHEVYLHAPVWPAEIQPKRDDAFRGVFMLSIEIRTVDGSAFNTQWTEAA